MNISRFSLLSLFFLLLTQGLFAQETSDYALKGASPGGTGKVYMGREIAQLMSFHGKDWLERPTRSKEENTALAISNLPVEKNSVVADIGAGSGYYTFRIAERVPEGKVYAVEIQDEAIKYLRERSLTLNAGQVEAIKGGEKSPNLPDDAIDLVVMVDVYHELLYPKEMLTGIKSALKADGKLLLIEYRGEDRKLRIKKLHKMTVAQITKELSANGFRLTRNGQFMNIQHFLVFEKE